MASALASTRPLRSGKVFYENTKVTFFVKLLAVDSGTGVIDFGKCSEQFFMEHHTHVFLSTIFFILFFYPPGNLVVKSKLPPRSGSSLEAVEPHP